MKKSFIVLTCFLVTLCIIMSAAFVELFFFSKSVKTYIVIQPQGTTVNSAEKVVVTSNQSFVIVDAGHASMDKNNQQVNVTVVQMQNDTQATNLFVFVKSQFLVQGFEYQNLTSPYPAVELTLTERPIIILLQKGPYIVMCLSYDVNTALEAANAQLNLP